MVILMSLLETLVLSVPISMSVFLKLTIVQLMPTARTLMVASIVRVLLVMLVMELLVKISMSVSNKLMTVIPTLHAPTLTVHSSAPVQMASAVTVTHVPMKTSVLIHL